MKFLLALLFGVLLSSLAANSEAGEETKTSANNSNNDDISHNDQCSIYIAKSTIPNAGLGIFTTRPYKVGDTLALTGDVCIPLLDIEFHNYMRYYIDSLNAPEHKLTTEKFQFIDPFGDYVWDGYSMGMNSVVDSNQEILTAFCPGLDAIPNYHPPLVNVDQALPRSQQTFHRYEYPGAAGSYSPFLNSTQYVLNDIPAGGELFKGYGESWFSIRSQDNDDFDKMPVGSDYSLAQRLLYKLERILDNNNNKKHTAPKTNSCKNDAYMDSTISPSSSPSFCYNHNPNYEEELYQLILYMRDRWNDAYEEEEYAMDGRQQELILYAIPSNYAQAKTVMKSSKPSTTAIDAASSNNVSTTTTTINNGFQLLYQSNATRSIEFLKKYGSCIDNVQVQKSTLVDAGHGAFASRLLKKDQIITTSPLIVVQNQSQLNLYNLSLLHTLHKPSNNGDDTSSNLPNLKIGEQLIKNYCFGHNNTELLLCPYGAGINYINHNQTYSNVRIQWPKPTASSSKSGTTTYDNSDFHQPHWLSQSISSTTVTNNKHAKIRLAIQYVALRDIKKGEELFIDYGDDWEQAWLLHQMDISQQVFDNVGVSNHDDDILDVQQPRPVHNENFREYVSANDWNDYFSHNDILWTEEERIEALSSSNNNNVFPNSIQLRCHSGIVTTERTRKAYNRLKWDDLDRGNSNSHHRHHHHHRYHYEYGYPCTVLSRTKDRLERYWYSVRVQVHEDQTDPNGGSNVTREEKQAGKYVLATNVPRSALRWFDKAKTTDIGLSTAFRHWIGLPDHMLPDAWKIQEDALSTTSRCELYIATSTIPNAGLGIYTTRARQVGEYIKDGNPAIPLFELSKHWERMSEAAQYWHDPTANYVWDGQDMGMADEVDPGGVSVFWPGINGAVNSNPILNNIDASAPQYDEAGLHRSTHPGAGAVTPYHLGMSHVSRYIPSGAELFKDYGDDYFTSRDGYQFIPLASDFAAAKSLLNKLFTDENKTSDTSTTAGDDDDEAFGGHDYNNTEGRRQILYELIIDIRKAWKTSRVLNALPLGYSDASMSRDISALHQEKSIRDHSWLKTYGRCLDQIVPKRSSIENAGHGAFAKRFMSAGTIITASPLLHMKLSYFDMYEEDVDNDVFGETEDDYQPLSTKVGHQVLINYCYGHSDSSIRLCPYGSGVGYMNHNQTLANVMIRWAADGMVGHNSSILGITTDELVGSYEYPCLAFEYIALRDIEQGEELFLDYGDAWETAWQEHTTNWAPELDWLHYGSATLWNSGGKAAEPLRTTDEQKQDPYPNNISLRCNSQLTSNATFPEDIPLLVFHWETPEYGLDCTIIARQISGDDDYFTYDALIATDDEEVLVQQIPRDGFRFFNLPYSTDMHLKKAFRHDIGIPDSIFPNLWKDLTSND